MGLDDVRRWWRSAGGFQRAQIVGWSAFSIVDLLNRLVTFHDFRIALVLAVLVSAFLAAASFALRRFYETRLFSQDISPLSGLLIVLASCLTALVAVTVVAQVRNLFDWSIPAWRPVQEFFVPLIYYSLVMFGWSAAYFWVRSDHEKRNAHHRAAQAEAEALRAELLQLRLQLDPHFLFNALNGVSEEIPEHPQAALTMLRHLSTYLRYSLDSISEPLATVGAEAAALSAYLKIQEARFGDRLSARVEVEEAARGRPIVSFLLQPLVENAIKHGTRRGGVRLAVSIHSHGDHLHILIENAGTLATGEAPGRSRSGVGLTNLRQRLALHYPARHRFVLREGDRPISPGEAVREGERVVTAELILEGEPCSER